MSGYRDDKKKLAALDRRTIGWHAANYGIGLVAVSIGIVVTGGPLVYAALAAVTGVPLLAYGLRNP